MYEGESETQLDQEDKTFYSTISKNDHVFIIPNLNMIDPIFWSCTIEKIKIKTNKETPAANNPAIETVVSFGVFFLYLKVTVNIANPKEDINPLTRPNSVPV